MDSMLYLTLNLKLKLTLNRTQNPIATLTLHLRRSKPGATVAEANVGAPFHATCLHEQFTPFGYDWANIGVQ